MTEAMPFLQKTILLSYDPRSLQAVCFYKGSIPLPFLFLFYLRRLLNIAVRLGYLGRYF